MRLLSFRVEEKEGKKEKLAFRHQFDVPADRTSLPNSVTCFRHESFVEQKNLKKGIVYMHTHTSSCWKPACGPSSSVTA
jgi:hypothetical protein